MKKWFLESTSKNVHSWYICWHEFYDTKNEAEDRLEELEWKSQGFLNDNGTKAKFRTKRWEIIRK